MQVSQRHGDVSRLDFIVRCFSGRLAPETCCSGVLVLYLMSTDRPIDCVLNLPHQDDPGM